jgi:hypothetical protein
VLSDPITPVVKTMPDNIELTLLVSASDADPDALDRATRHLRAELQDLPIDSASLATAGELPVGAKAGDAVALGALTLSLAPVVVPALIDFLKGWMARTEGRTVVIRTRLGDATTEVEIKAPLSESAIAALVERLTPQKRPATTGL